MTSAAGRSIRVAVIGGDGIGPGVVAEATKVMLAAAGDVTVETTSYGPGATRWHRTGEAVADDLAERQGAGAARSAREVGTISPSGWRPTKDSRNGRRRARPAG